MNAIPTRAQHAATLAVMDDLNHKRLSDEFDRTICYATRTRIRSLRFELSVKAGYLAADLGPASGAVRAGPSAVSSWHSAAAWQCARRATAQVSSGSRCHAALQDDRIGIGRA